MFPQDEPEGLAIRGYALARLGERAEAEKIIAVLEEQRKLGRMIDPPGSVVYLGLGEFDKAIDALERVEAEQGLDEEVACGAIFPLK